MASRSRRLIAAVLGVVILAYWTPATGAWLGRTGLRAMAGVSATFRTFGVPRPVAIVAGSLVMALVSFALIVLVFRTVLEALSRRRGTIGRVRRLLSPDAPDTKAYVLIGVFVVVGLVVLWQALPYFAASLTPDSNVDRFFQQVEAADDERGAVFENDTVRYTASQPAGSLDGDTDGDGLLDSWERAGQTPTGVPLPDADPRHKDVYVHLAYGSGVDPLTAQERSQVAAIWGSMPVENPDGTDGIRVHFHPMQSFDSLRDRRVSITGSEDLDAYSRTWADGRHCVYYHVTFGTVRDGDSLGYAATPGHASILDGSRRDGYDGDVSFRVATLTHLLLHNVVGTVDGRVHMDGWLAPPPTGGEYLPSSAAAKLSASGFAVSPAPHQQCPVEPDRN